MMRCYPNSHSWFARLLPLALLLSAGITCAEEDATLFPISEKTSR